MRAITLLITWMALAGMVAPCGAAPLLFTIEGLEGVDVAQRDSTGAVRSLEAEDADGEGVFSFVFEVDPDPMAATIIVHIKDGPAYSHFVFVEIKKPVLDEQDEHFPLIYPFFVTDTDDRAITLWPDPPEMRFALGDPVSVADGMIAGLDAVVYVSPGTGSAVEALDVELAGLELYTGPLSVGGRMTIVPEPAGAMLFILGVFGLTFRRPARRGADIDPGSANFRSLQITGSLHSKLL